MKMLTCTVSVIVFLLIVAIVSYQIGATDARVDTEMEMTKSFYDDLQDRNTIISNYEKASIKDLEYIGRLKTANCELSTKLSKLTYILEHTWDYQLMCQLVEAEASGLSMTEKQKVASVIFNRVKSESFPNTIMDVITAEHQFTPMSNGTAYETEAMDGTKVAVYKAISCDNSGGALFFNDYYSLEFTEYYDNDLELISRNKDISFYKFKEEKK